MENLKGVKKEYGGYLEFGDMRGSEYYTGMYKLNLARTSLIWLLSHIPHNRVFLPLFICDTVNETAEAAGYRLVSYRMDENLRPVWGEKGAPEEDDIFYLVNYNGLLTEADIVRYRETFNTVIVDNAQAFFSEPIAGVHTIYSLRKFIGVTDGAYVASDIEGTTDSLPMDKSTERAKYLVGRLEGFANDYYAESKSAEVGYSGETPKQMSRFTQMILKGTDYEYIKNKRRENYAALNALLKSDNPFTKATPECPYLYPYYHEDGMSLRKYLVENKIYVPTLWDFLLDEKYEGTLEYEWASNITWLPIDQRYDESDMQSIADVVRNY
ncbi:MAG: hypothetical protein IKE52_05535 [Mogibacterium sp.]|nr:hypothetical protein [Mogibacterium sp.]